MAFPRPEDYKTHEGPRGSPTDWTRKAKRITGAVRAHDSKVAKSLKTLGLEDIPKSERDLKRAYRKAAIKTHPDQGGSNEAFLEVQAAFEVLSNVK